MCAYGQGAENWDGGGGVVCLMYVNYTDRLMQIYIRN